MGNSDVERIARLETEMIAMKEFKSDHIKLHEGMNVNKQAWAMIVMTGLNILVAVWGIKVASDSTKPNQPIGIERQYQGNDK
jgi:hypothetical protein